MIKYTRQNVLQAANRLFPNDQKEILDLLDEYGREIHHKEKERTHLAILKLSAGDLDVLKKYLDLAKNDYRDVLMLAGDTWNGATPYEYLIR